MVGVWIGGFLGTGGWGWLLWVDKEGYLGVGFCVVVCGGVEWRGEVLWWWYACVVLIMEREREDVDQREGREGCL